MPPNPRPQERPGTTTIQNNHESRIAALERRVAEAGWRYNIFNGDQSEGETKHGWGYVQFDDSTDHTQGELGGLFEDITGQGVMFISVTEDGLGSVVAEPGQVSTRAVSNDGIGKEFLQGAQWQARDEAGLPVWFLLIDATAGFQAQSTDCQISVIGNQATIRTNLSGTPVEFELDNSGTLAMVVKRGGQELFRVDNDGTLHGKTGAGPLLFDL